MVSRRGVLLGGAALLGAGGGVTWRGYTRAMAEARARIGPALSRMADTRHGPCEWAEAGDGSPVLFLHGTGGGFDQGLAMGAPLAARGWRMICPSRFGYLRTPLPPDPSADAQAEALADLLDHLGLERVAVAGGSAGAIPALAFAARFPDRTSAVVALVPAAYVPGRPLPEPWGPVTTWLAEAALKSDFVFWAATVAARDRLTAALLATDPALVRAAGPTEETRVRAILDGILPISARADGLANDARETGRPAPLDYAAITAPVLALSLEDDRFDTAANARHIAGAVPRGEAVVLPEGGHVWAGREAEVFATIDAFLRRAGAG